MKNIEVSMDEIRSALEAALACVDTIENRSGGSHIIAGENGPPVQDILKVFYDTSHVLALVPAMTRILDWAWCNMDLIPDGALKAEITIAHGIIFENGTGEKR